MDYFSVLQRIRDGEDFQKIQIEGGQTEGRILFDLPKPKPKGRNIMSGYQYADDIKAKERLEDLKIDEELRRGKGMSMVEDLTSVGTLPNINDLNTDSLTQVYSNYSFKRKPEKRLLIHDYKDEILEQINTSQVTIIKGVTGCGKTTQVPQFILDQHEEINMHCNIVVTQPRRIAAISVAKRVCQERGWSVGSIVGYQIALDKTASPDTRLLYCTTGCLLQALVKKQSLNDYTHIVIDEIHERDSETDFLLIVIRKLLKSIQCRTKVILMSATMNTSPFVDYFSRIVRGVAIEPPVIELHSETNYPVQFFYLDSLAQRLPVKMPDIQMSSPGIESCTYDLARALVEVFHVIDEHEHPDSEFFGSVLIFLPGLAEIENMYGKLSCEKPKSGEEWWLCPLHSSVTHEEQQFVFKPPPKGSRKIILATNIAESSITVTDIKYVIDFCLGKMQVTDQETGYSLLQMTWISKSQGTQRAGRVGRVMPGRVYRLMPKALYMELSDDLSPEIMRCPLDLLVLKAKQLNMGSPEELLGLALDPPDLSNITKTTLRLKELGALRLTTNGEYKDNDGDLTFVGNVMASLPLDTQLTKLILLGHLFSLLPEAIVMACALSMKSIFSTPFQMQLKAYTTKLSWADFSCSDPIAFYNAYVLWRHKTNLGYFKRSGGQSEEHWCRSMFIQKNIIKEVSRLEYEITTRLRRLGIEEIKGDAKVTWTNVEKALIMKIILAGAFYPNYFMPYGTDEKESVKILGGRDPFNTVYLSGMPNNQPGPLYTHSIKKCFSHCGSGIKVSFDGSSKVYLQFGSSILKQDDTEKETLMPGKISLAVYRAIKMRQLMIPITIPVLLPNEARRRAQEIFGDRLKPAIFCFNEKKGGPVAKKSQMPSLSTSILQVVISHIDSPSRFWVNINDEATRKKHAWIQSSINNPKLPLPSLVARDLREGNICAAPYKDLHVDRCQFYRAKILLVDHYSDINTAQVYVHFIDYGNEEKLLAKDLRCFTDDLRDVRDEPPLALQASLAEIGPAFNRNPKGDWAAEAINKFKNYFPDNLAIAKVYSAINDVMALTLYHFRALRNMSGELPPEASLNHQFVNWGLAEPTDEPYLSRENHMIRENAENSPQVLNSLSDHSLSYFDCSDIKFTPPSEAECRSKVTLKGPKSPLEMNLHSFPKKCQGKEIQIEWNSVNSVLLDTYPMDPHTRLIVAATVTHSHSEKLTLRNTTIMPNIHGLPGLMCLIFAPRVELRADPERRSLTGALCGLGFDPETGVSFYPENDIEVTFDTKFSLLDLEKVNRLRFWMDHILGGGEGPEPDLCTATVVTAQTKIKEHIVELLNKRRPGTVPRGGTVPFEWDQVPSEELLDPHGNPTSLYPLIWGINLIGDGKRDNIIMAHLETLESLAAGREIMRNGIQCELCQVTLPTLPDLKLHLATTLHKLNVKDFKECSSG